MLDEDAFEQLRLYLVKLEKQFENTEGAKEIVEDIECRIAELLQSKIGESKEVINLCDVKEVLEVMGEPEAYTDDEGGETKSPLNRTKGKWYREPQNAIIGGVASGLATYLGINAVWIRLFFLITIFAWTTGFWLYLILWLVLPKRNLSPSRPDDKNMTPFENLLNSIFVFIGKVFRFIWRAITIILGICLILAGFPVLIAMLGVSVFPMFHWFDWNGLTLIEVMDFFNYAVVGNHSGFVLLLALLVALIPVLLITYWGVRLLLLIKVKDAWLHVSAGLVWIASVVLLGMFGVMNATMVKENESYEERYELSVAPDTLWIKMNAPIDKKYYDKSIGISDEPIELFYNEEDKATCALVDLEMYNSSDSLAFFQIEKKALGATRSQAMANIRDVKYDFENDDKHLAIDEGFICSTEDYPWLPSWVEVEVYVPKGTVLVIDRKLKRLGKIEHRLYRLDNEVIYRDYE